MNYCARMASWQSSGQITFRMIVATLIFLGCAPAKSTPTYRSYFRAGLRNSDSRPIATNHLQKLLTSLRQKTGLMDLNFDSDGFLDIGDRNHVEGGSATARAL